MTCPLAKGAIIAVLEQFAYQRRLSSITSEGLNEGCIQSIGAQA